MSAPETAETLLEDEERRRRSAVRIKEVVGAIGDVDDQPVIARLIRVVCVDDIKSRFR